MGDRVGGQQCQDTVMTGLACVGIREGKWRVQRQRADTRDLELRVSWRVLHRSLGVVRWVKWAHWAGCRDILEVSVA